LGGGAAFSKTGCGRDEGSVEQHLYILLGRGEAGRPSGQPFERLWSPVVADDSELHDVDPEQHCGGGVDDAELHPRARDA
jgi:hypothetical protein